MGYVYKFYTEDELIYIGRTADLKNRMHTHFGKDLYGNKLPREVYESIKRIEYTETRTMSDAIVLEAYLVAKNKPRYNREYVTDDELTLEIDVSGFEWKEYTEAFGMESQRIYFWKDGVLEYEIPLKEEVYTLLVKELGITHGYQMPYGSAFYENGYKVMKNTNKHKTAIPKYKFMGYPELSEWQIRGHR